MTIDYDNEPQFCPDRQIAAIAARHGISFKKAIHNLLEQGIWPERFRRNFGLIQATEQQKLLDLPILVAGCGGLGGAVSSQLARLGAASLLLCDYDNFDESNLNRQRFCTEKNLNQKKAVEGAKCLRQIASWGNFEPVLEQLNPQNLTDKLENCTIVFDCLDSVSAKLMLEAAARKTGIAWVHGSVLGQEGIVCLKSSAGNTLQALYGDSCSNSGAGSTLAHVVDGVASIMTALFLKWLSRPDYSSPLLHFDFSVPELEKFSLSS